MGALFEWLCGCSEDARYSLPGLVHVAEPPKNVAFLRACFLKSSLFMSQPIVAIAGAGAAGYFAAIACAEANRDQRVILFEATAHPLAKVRISGGGRCNVTHACFEPRELVKRYPRGSRELLGAFHRWQPRDTVEWFAARGVELKTEPDGRMFPITDQSTTIVTCLQREAERTGVEVRLKCGLVSATPLRPEGFALTLTTGEAISVRRLLLATGGTRGSAGFSIAEKLGHTIEPLAPSLFTFNVDDPRLREIPGVAVPSTTASVPALKLSETGPTLITHWGLSGPAILRVSAWGARELQAVDYRFTVRINWAGPAKIESLRAELQTQRRLHPRRQVSNTPVASIPQRLWEKLSAAAGIATTTTWSGLSASAAFALADQIGASEFSVTGKSTNKDEFVTCGGVRLRDVDFRTMESRLCAGLHFAGEVLDIDGITGGFNFQAAWTTGLLAGRAMAGVAAAAL